MRGPSDAPCDARARARTLLRRFMAKPLHVNVVENLWQHVLKKNPKWFDQQAPAPYPTPPQPPFWGASPCREPEWSGGKGEALLAPPCSLPPAHRKQALALHYLPAPTARASVQHTAHTDGPAPSSSGPQLECNRARGRRGGARAVRVQTTMTFRVPGGRTEIIT